MTTQPFTGNMFSFTIDDSTARQIEYYTYLNDEINDLYSKAVSDQIFGIWDSCSLKTINYLNYLFMYLESIQLERDLYILVNGTDQANLYWNSLYCIECIKKKLYCKGIKSETINKIFGMYNLNQGTSSSGVGFDIINSTLTVY